MRGSKLEILFLFPVFPIIFTQYIFFSHFQGTWGTSAVQPAVLNYAKDELNAIIGFEDKGAGTFHSAGQSKEGSVGFGTSQQPIIMKLLPDHLWH